MKPLIPKVPHQLREDADHVTGNRGAYDPRAVSFGPYHHGKQGLEHCQKAKDLTVKMFVKSSNQSREFYYDKVLDAVADARNFYCEGSTDKFSDDRFAEMMLQDACFLIYFMRIDKENRERRLAIDNHLGRLTLSLIQRDIYLVENQIPYKILMLLVKLRYKSQGEEAMSKFLHKLIWDRFDFNDHNCFAHTRHQPHSLFDAFRRVLVCSWTSKPDIHLTKKVQAKPEKCHDDDDDNKEQEPDVKRHFRVYRSAKDMKAKGIHFKPSQCNSIRSIKFSSYFCYGILELPTWFVTKQARVFFLNMIAYELCPNNNVPSIMMNYVNFMKTIIDSADDVKVLRECRILFTTLGDDQEVSDLYRDLNTYGMADAKSFKEVKHKIQTHYDSTRKTLMSQFFSIYFGTPWAIMGWIVGVLVLLLNIVQAYFTINPPII